MAKLLAEELSAERQDEISLGIAVPLADAVVDERDPDLPRGKPCDPLDGCCQGDAEKADERRRAPLAEGRKAACRYNPKSCRKRVVAVGNWFDIRVWLPSSLSNSK